ncbi:hypothetical protein [Amycolatopsis anabasis]|uniref:hypothetical protein n=1 Tax=Amycolatopsis anabasis TaxID=1840409 RepID=UPI00131CF01C|nr:hypothetical protein [Amycolatopsis anabasis]
MPELDGQLTPAQQVRCACVSAAARAVPGEAPLTDDLLAIARYVETGLISGDSAGSSSGAEGDDHAPSAAG